MLISGATFVKTPKGVDEVNKRTHGLGPRVRQMLIMVNGKRDMAELLAIFPPDLVPDMLAQLADGGFVQQVQTPPPVVALPTVHVGQPTVSLGGTDEDPFELGQMFMVNLAKRILGVAGDPIIAKLRATHSVDELRGMYLEWRSTIKQAPDGLLRLKELEKKLAKVLGNLPTP